MNAMRRGLSMLVCLLLPARLKPPLLRMLGHRIAPGVRIAPSLIRVDLLVLAPETSIGAFNYIHVRRLVLRRGAFLERFNFLHGAFSIRLGERSTLGARIVANRGPSIGTLRPAQLYLGKVSSIVAGHYVNVDESIRLGDYTTIAGVGSQLWTHGFVHSSVGPERAEVRGNITIGNNVFVGSACCIGPGVRIVDAVSIAPNVSVGSSLLEPGHYVPQPLRCLTSTPAERLSRLRRVETRLGAYYWRDQDAR